MAHYGFTFEAGTEVKLVVVVYGSDSIKVFQKNKKIWLFDSICLLSFSDSAIRQKNATDKATASILHSLLAVCVLELFGWMGDFLVQNICKLLGTSAATLWYADSIEQFFLIIALALNAPILYWLRYVRVC
jgi:hypothetical protein